MTKTDLFLLLAAGGAAVAAIVWWKKTAPTPLVLKPPVTPSAPIALRGVMSPGISLLNPNDPLHRPPA